MVERANNARSCFSFCGQSPSPTKSILKGNANSFLIIPENFTLEKESMAPIQVYSQRDLQQRMDLYRKKKNRTERKMYEIKNKYGYPPKEHKFFHTHMLLLLEVMEGKNLKHSNNMFRKSSPMVKVKCPHLKGEKKTHREYITGKGKESNINPKWHQIFKLTFPQPLVEGCDYFTLGVYNSHKWGGTSILGHENTFHLSQLKGGEIYKHHINLTKQVGGISEGQLTIRIQLLDQTEQQIKKIMKALDNRVGLLKKILLKFHNALKAMEEGARALPFVGHEKIERCTQGM